MVEGENDTGLFQRGEGRSLSWNEFFYRALIFSIR